MDVVSSVIVDTVAASASAGGGSLPLSGDMAADAARFAELVAQPGAAGAAGPAGAVGPVPVAAGVEGAAPAPSLGDAILDGVAALGRPYLDSTQKLASVMHRTLEGPDKLSPGDLIALQGSLAERTLHIDILCKIGHQVGSTLTDLTKLQ